MLFIHISIALLSLAASGLTYVRPAQKFFMVSYILVGGTLVTGTALVISAPTHLGMACVSGLVYLALVSATIGAARLKFVAGR